MKIAISALQVSENNSGVGESIVNLVGSLVKQFSEDYLIYHSLGVDLTTWISGENVCFREINAVKEDFINRSMFEVFQFGWDVKRNRADIFFSPDTKLPWGLPHSTRTIVNVNDLAVFKHPQTYQKSRVFYWQYLFASSIRRADKVVAISQATKDDIQELLGVPAEKIDVIYLGVGEEFRPIRDSKQCWDVRTRYGLPEKFILFVGTFSPRKNLGRLIEAFSVLQKKTNLPHKLVIAGEKGWKFQQDLERVKLLGLENKIFFPGYIAKHDLPFVYSMADVLAYPSLYEGFGLPPLEAMACGTPVVASQTSSLPEVVGEAGLLVDPYSIGEIAGALERVLVDESLKDRLSAAGLKRAKLFTWEKAAQKLHRLMVSG